MVTSTSVAASGGSLHLDNGKATGNMVCYHGRVKTRMNIHTNTSADKRDDATSGTPYDIPEDDPANASTDAHAHGNASTPEPPRARRRRPRRIAIAFATLAVLAFMGAAAFVLYASDHPPDRRRRPCGQPRPPTRAPRRARPELPGLRRPCRKHGHRVLSRGEGGVHGL